MKSIFKVALCMIVLLPLYSCVSKISSVQHDKIATLEENIGYLFITIDTNINFSKFSISGTQKIQLEKPDQYQVNQFGTQCGAKYSFDSDEDEKLWSFSVMPGVISYVGEIRVRNLRYLSSTFELINNSSLALEYLEEKYPKILANRVLEYHGPGVDSFFDLVLEKSEEKL